ncbi:HipA domain-containing protein [Herbaspirillum sp. RU 5E]|uniref:type II toxin-antitoxin system HipA family toxin n=1 Tax=Herbaspirillum sp. CAH-3 TaxID=2605746 RepID=UPI0012AC817A|nr:HipA domain-containing protein [Herbaspirillum sp. CAH-3]MBW9331953.1 HipA domain-containing protein [Herbaspirillum sp. RU 5E]MRT28719.1 HipA domain-containing protein [Herbaspirillum sp. CAH-3]
MRQTACTVFDCSNPDAPRPVAGFALDTNGDGKLGYGKHYVTRPDAFALDPVHLPLQTDLHAVRRRRDGSFGVLSDAGPNAWGVRLTSSINRQYGRPQPETPVDWFVHCWQFGSGCLGFSEHHSVLPIPGNPPEPLSRLDERQAQAIEALTADADSELDEEALRLFFPGASLGGVRPKTVVLHEGRETIAKFSRLDDRFDVPTVEYATLRLAHLAGIDVPDFELVMLGSRSLLLLARFDRTDDGRRLHYLSANSLIDIDEVGAEHYRTRYSYAGIAEALRPLDDHAAQDAPELFRRMVFNIFIGNVDDHMRNHALLRDASGRYRLSPAFDLLPHLDAAYLPQSIGVGAHGAASTTANALSQCHRFLLKPPEAQKIIEEVRATVAGWRSLFAQCGVSRTDLHLLESCIDPGR